MGNTELGNRIQLIRKRRRMTQAELAEKLGVSRSAVSMWEYGSNEPNLDTIKKLASALEVQYETLLIPEDEMKRRVPLKTLEEFDGDYLAAIDWLLTIGDVVLAPKTNAQSKEADLLEALHQNPRLGLLFDRARNLDPEDVDFMLKYAERILKERDGN